MRIEICAAGPNTVMELYVGMTKLRSDITATIEDLRAVNRKMAALPGDLGPLQNAYSDVQSRIAKEQSRVAAVEQISEETTQFLNDTITVDSNVARLVRQNEERFFNSHEWLRPVVEEDKPWWQQAIDAWNGFWSSAGEAIASLVDGVVNWVKEHAVELVIGAVAIVVGAAIMALTAGTAAAFLPALLAGVKAAGIAAAISGTISGVSAAIKGENVLEAIGDGLASGFMLGGIGFASGASVLHFVGKDFLVAHSVWGAIGRSAAFGGMTNAIASPVSTAVNYYLQNGTLDGSGEVIVRNTLIGVASGFTIGGITGGVKFLVSEHHMRQVERSIMNRDDLRPTEKGKMFEKFQIKEFEKRFPNAKHDSQCHLEADQLVNKQGNVSYQKPDLLLENGDKSFINYDFKWNSAGKTFNQTTLTGSGDSHLFDTVITHTNTNFSTNVVPAGTPFKIIHASIFDPTASMNTVIGLPIDSSVIVGETTGVQAVLYNTAQREAPQ